jgi:hypothetical protein
MPVSLPFRATAMFVCSMLRSVTLECRSLADYHTEFRKNPSSVSQVETCQQVDGQVQSFVRLCCAHRGKNG